MLSLTASTCPKLRNSKLARCGRLSAEDDISPSQRRDILAANSAYVVIWADFLNTGH
jgi:hypothetical protein